MNVLNPLHTYKSKVEQAFSKHVASYDKNACLQMHAAEHSAQLLASIKSRFAVPEGEILEIGCGTGLFSAKLLNSFPERKIICTDLSDEMLATCQIRLGQQSTFSQLIEFQNLDAEFLTHDSKFALIASSFALQWFFEPIEGLARLFEALKPGGILLFSVPGSDSCPEWQTAAANLCIPFTRNPLPSKTELQKLAIRSGMEFRLNHHFFEQCYPDAMTMLRSIKELGANTQRHDLQLTGIQLRRLLSELDSKGQPLVTSYEVIAGYFRKIKD